MLFDLIAQYTHLENFSPGRGWARSNLHRALANFILRRAYRSWNIAGVTTHGSGQIGLSGEEAGLSNEVEIEKADHISAIKME